MARADSAAVALEIGRPDRRYGPPPRALEIAHALGWLLHALRRIVQRTRDAHGRLRHARRIRTELALLDDRTLRDIGFCRDEITSVAAEMAGCAERTRLRVLRDLP